MARTAQVFGPMAPITDELPPYAPDGFTYDLIYVPGVVQGNALRNRAENDAALAQTQKEHNDALNTYLAAMQYPPAVREMMGRQVEKNLAKWNPKEDKKPRRPLTPSSSVISELKILPNNHIGVKFNNRGPKSGDPYYEYKGGNTVQEAAQEVLKLINSSSLGRELNTKIAGSWGAAHKL